MEIGVEGAFFRIGPGLAAALAQMGQQLGIVPGTAELNGVKLRRLVKFQEFSVGFDSGIVRGTGENPAHVAGNPGRAEMPQHADPLVALLDIKVAQILIAEDGVGDAGVPQVGAAKGNPLGGELTFAVQQRAEGGSKSGDPPGAFHADDPLGGNLDQTDVHDALSHTLGQQLVQYLRMGAAARHQQFPVFFLAHAQGLGIFFHCGLCDHGSLLDRKDIFPYIIPHFCPFAT